MFFAPFDFFDFFSFGIEAQAQKGSRGADLKTRASHAKTKVWLNIIEASGCDSRMAASKKARTVVA
jgi:hypothetical protein